MDLRLFRASALQATHRAPTAPVGWHYASALGVENEPSSTDWSLDTADLLERGDDVSEY